ncbi:MAG: gamma-glutamyltransferase [Spirulinaceae cyanobacterium]
MKRRSIFLSLALSILLLFGYFTRLPAQSQPKPLAVGTGGAVASVDERATKIGIEILRSGGNAVDAAVATAAAIGVTDPFSAGIGGGGFMLIYQPDKNIVISLDGREEAPAATTPDLFRDPESETGELLPFYPDRITSGLAVGVPGTPLNWQTALDRYGTISLAEALQPAIALAEEGFIVDETFAAQIRRNQDRFAAFTSTQALYLPNNRVPDVGSRFRNLDLAQTYRQLAREGVNAFYRGQIGEAIAQTVQNPPVVASPPFTVWPGRLTQADLDRYAVQVRSPVVSEYRGYQLYGMGLPSSGGLTIAQTLNLLAEGMSDPVQVWHHLIEAERLAFSDRNAYLGDSEFVDVPIAGLLSVDYAQQRQSQIPPQAPINEAEYRATPGNPLLYQTDPSPSLTTVATVGLNVPEESLSTTHLTVIDGEGMVVSYTLTLEATGGSGIVVPGYGFILNNELTDFTAEIPHPNVPEPGKRPRSSMSPTIAIAGGGTVLALGSPGGSTIITTVLGILVNVIELQMSLPDAIAFPRLSQRNGGLTLVEQSESDASLHPFLEALKEEYGHEFTTTEEIGAATAIEQAPDGTLRAVAEPFRRGGGSAMTVR